MRLCPLMPTWTNRWAGVNFIGKSLYRVMVKDSLMEILGDPRSSIMVSDISDHMPIILTWNICGEIKG